MQLSDEIYERIVGSAAPADTGGTNDGLVAPAGARTEERRTAVRIAFGERAKLRCDDPRHGGITDTVMLQDISVQGIGLLSATALNINETFVLTLKDRQGQPLYIRCIVRRCQPGGLGGESFIIGGTFEEMLESPQQAPSIPATGIAAPPPRRTVLEKLNPLKWLKRPTSTPELPPPAPVAAAPVSEIVVEPPESLVDKCILPQRTSSLFASSPAAEVKLPTIDAPQMAAAEDAVPPPPQEPAPAQEFSPVQTPSQPQPQMPTQPVLLPLPGYLRRAKPAQWVAWLAAQHVERQDMPAAAMQLGVDGSLLIAPLIAEALRNAAEEFEQWSVRDLTGKRYLYLWAEELPGELRVLSGATSDGKRELVALARQIPWAEMLADLMARGLTRPPKLAIIGAAGFGESLATISPITPQQTPWDGLRHAPRKFKLALRDIESAATRAEAVALLDRLMAENPPTDPGLVDLLTRGRRGLLAFHDFPAEHGPYIRSCKAVEIALVGIDTVKTDLSLVYKLTQSAQRTMRKLKVAGENSRGKRAA